MARSAVAVLLVALVVLAMTADVSAKFCRTSAYSGVSVSTVTANKKAMFKACGADVTVLESGTKNGCTFIKQQVASKEAWDKYSACEKTDVNKASYGPLKAGSEACKGEQKSGAC